MTITTTTQPAPTAEQAAQLVGEYLTLAEQLAALSAQVDTINDRLEQIKAELRNLGEGTHEVAGRAVAIIPQRRFNADRASLILPPDTLAQITAPAVSSSLAKRVLAPALYEACMVASGTPRVVIK